MHRFWGDTHFQSVDCLVSSTRLLGVPFSVFSCLGSSPLRPGLRGLWMLSPCVFVSLSHHCTSRRWPSRCKAWCVGPYLSVCLSSPLSILSAPPPISYAPTTTTTTASGKELPMGRAVCSPVSSAADLQGPERCTAYHWCSRIGRAGTQYLFPQSIMCVFLSSRPNLLIFPSFPPCLVSQMHTDCDTVMVYSQ